MTFDPRVHPHRRSNPLTGEFVLVSPHRGDRPWLGRQEAPDVELRPGYDPDCYLCPGNARASGVVNPDFKGVFVFDNDFPAVRAQAPAPADRDVLYQVEAVRGACRVVCFSPDHGATLPELPVEALSLGGARRRRFSPGPTPMFRCLKTRAR